MFDPSDVVIVKGCVPLGDRPLLRVFSALLPSLIPTVCLDACTSVTCGTPGGGPPVTICVFVRFMVLAGRSCFAPLLFHCRFLLRLFVCMVWRCVRFSGAAPLEDFFCGVPLCPVFVCLLHRDVAACLHMTCDILCMLSGEPVLECEGVCF